MDGAWGPLWQRLHHVSTLLWGFVLIFNFKVSKRPAFKTINQRQSSIPRPWQYWLHFRKTDVWSFGVLMWEIVTLGSTPYPGMSGSEVMKRVREGVRLEKPEHCDRWYKAETCDNNHQILGLSYLLIYFIFVREIYNMMFYCWDNDPQERPSFSQLVKVNITHWSLLVIDICCSQDLESLLTQGTDYIDLNLFPEHGYYNEVSLSGERVWDMRRRL